METALKTFNIMDKLQVKDALLNIQLIIGEEEKSTYFQYLYESRAGLNLGRRNYNNSFGRILLDLFLTYMDFDKS